MSIEQNWLVFVSGWMKLDLHSWCIFIHLCGYVNFWAAAALL